MYTITYEMALDLVRTYVERLHVAEKRRGLTGKKLESWTVARDNLTNLLVQLKLNGHDPDQILEDIKKELRIKFSHKKVMVQIDGAARGNDDPEVDNHSGFGYIIYGDDTVITKHAEYIGSHVELPLAPGEDEAAPRLTVEATNNVAEYSALIAALEYLIEHDISAPDIVVISDSNTVVQQVNLTNATRASHLLRLRDHAKRLKDHFPGLRLVHSPRSNQAEVDALVNEAIDEAMKNS